MSFQSLIDKTRQLEREFVKRGNKYDKRSRLIDLMEEVGELAQAVHIVEGFKHTNHPNKQKTREDVINAICDCMYELILLAGDYDIDLPLEYSHTVDEIRQRLESGEFQRDN